jgi:hypothetical protein
MERYIGLDVHAAGCTVAVISEAGGTGAIGCVSATSDRWRFCQLRPNEAIRPATATFPMLQLHLTGRVLGDVTRTQPILPIPSARPTTGYDGSHGSVATRPVASREFGFETALRWPRLPPEVGYTPRDSDAAGL